MTEQRSNGHTVSRLSVHLVWSTKYRYDVLVGDIQIRCRTLLIQICESEDVTILKGVVSKNHIHMHLEYRPSASVSSLVKKLKRHSSSKIQQEFPVLKRKYFGRQFWAIGYGCWSTGTITDKMVDAFLEHHKNPKDGNNTNFVIE